MKTIRTLSWLVALAGLIASCSLPAQTTRFAPGESPDQGTNSADATTDTGSRHGRIWRQQRTPLLMVSSFAHVLCAPTEAWITNALAGLLTNGMRAAGWDCVALEDGQYLPSIDGPGRLQVNPTNFPHGLKWLTDFAHARGFRMCNYITSSALGNACCPQGNPGSPDELLALHIQQTRAWGFDGLIIDECGRSSLDEAHLQFVIQTFNEVAVDGPSPENETNAHRGMFLIATANCGYAGTDLVPGEAPVEANLLGVPWFAPELNGQSNLLVLAKMCLKYSRFVGPGHTLDPTSFLHHAEVLPRAELQQILSVYAMLCGPLQIGFPAPDAVPCLTDREYLAIHQDPAVIPCTVQYSNRLAEVWTRPLGGARTGTNAVLLVNAAPTNQAITVTASMLGAGSSDPLAIRDVWRHQASSNFTGSFTWLVPATNSVLLRVNREPAPGSPHP